MRLYLALPSLFLLFGGTALAADAWLAFHDPAGVFVADEQGAPTVAHDSVKKPDGTSIDITEYAVDRGNAQSMIMVSDLTHYLNADPNKVLESSANSAKAAALLALADTAIQLDGQAGRDILFIDTGNNRVESKTFFVGMRLYQFVSIVPKGYTPAQLADAQHFQDSIHFTAH